MSDKCLMLIPAVSSELFWIWRINHCRHSRLKESNVPVCKTAECCIEGPKTSDPNKFIRYVYNRVILENATVRAGAVSGLAKSGFYVVSLRAWELLYLCASVMPPGEDFGAYLSEYVHEVASSENGDSEIQVLALHTWNALKRITKAGPRRSLRAVEEIEGLLSGRKLKTIAFFLDVTFEEISHDITTTVTDAVEKSIWHWMRTSTLVIILLNLKQQRNVIKGIFCSASCYSRSGFPENLMKPSRI